MEFDVFTTTVQLQDIPSYTTNIILEGQLLTLSLLWNERVGKRVLSIKNSNDEYYLQNIILHPNEPFELNSNAVFDDLPYKVILQKVGDSKKVGNIFNWSKDFILCFSRTVDLDVKKLNVVYGVTTPSTPILPPPTPAFGDWILNQGFAILGYDIRYTGYKTNDIDTYDSFALSNLQDALVKSFLDPDLQKYAAFTTAVEQLIGNVDWTIDPASNQIRYTETTNKTCASYADCSGYADIWMSNVGKLLYTTPDCVAEIGAYGWWGNTLTVPISETVVECRGSNSGTVISNMVRVANPAYDPVDEEGQKTLPLDVVAAQVISNAASSADEVLKLLSEDYINLVANSVFDSNPSKQFVKLEDLIPQLETNKILR